MVNNSCDDLNIYKDLQHSFNMSNILVFEKVLLPFCVATVRISNLLAHWASMFLTRHGFNAVGQVWDCESVTTGGG